MSENTHHVRYTDANGYSGTAPFEHGSNLRGRALALAAEIRATGGTVHGIVELTPSGKVTVEESAAGIEQQAILTIPALTLALGDIEMPAHGEIVDVYYDAIAYYSDAPGPVVTMTLWNDTPEHARRVLIVRQRYGKGIQAIDPMTNRPVLLDPQQRELCAGIWDAVGEIYRRAMVEFQRAAAPAIRDRIATPATGEDAPVRAAN